MSEKNNNKSYTQLTLTQNIMRGELEKEGKYELFETTHGHEILVLNNKNWFAIVKTKQGQILVHSDSDHKKKRALQKGEFYLANFENDPSFKDMPHLFLKEGKKYQEFILPNDLPTNKKPQKKLVVVDEKIPEKKVMKHVKEEWDTINEKQNKEPNMAENKKENTPKAKSNGSKNPTATAKEKQENSDKRKQTVSKSGRELKSLSRIDLYQQAKKKDISGRSKMTKEELIKALKK